MMNAAFQNGLVVGLWVLAMVATRHDALTKADIPSRAFEARR